jgi:hypothetical protein
MKTWLPFDEVQPIHDASLLHKQMPVGQRVHTDAGAQAVDFAGSPLRKLFHIVEKCAPVQRQ